MINKYHDVKVDNVMFGPKGIVIQWSGSIGFGEVSLYKGDKGEILIDTEYMTEDFVKNVFSRLIDKATLK